MAFKTVLIAIFAVLVGGAPSFSQAAANVLSVQPHLRQAQEFLRTGRPDLAVGEFRAVLKLDPENVTARSNLGTLLYFEGDYEKAAVELRAALKSSPKNNPDLWKTQTLLGMSEKRTGHITSARTNLEKAFPHLQEEKLRVEAGMELVEIYYASGDLEMAAGVVGVLRRLRPEDPGILFTAHRIYSEQADEAMLGVSMLAPNSAWMHRLMAHEMVRQGDTKGAITHLREALKIDPNVPGLHFELAEVLGGSTSIADQHESEKEYQAALAHNPLDEKSECRLGRIAFKESELKDAFAHYSHALELQPGDPEANLGLGRVLVAMDQPKKAQPLLENAVRLDPSDAVAHFRLGTLYRQMGRPEDARKELAEYQRFKQMKEQLGGLYKEMRLQSRAAEAQTDIPQ
jgi:cytochrome c-type biogenesis protein CcmH/NrfG